MSRYTNRYFRFLHSCSCFFFFLEPTPLKNRICIFVLARHKDWSSLTRIIWFCIQEKIMQNLSTTWDSLQLASREERLKYDSKPLQLKANDSHFQLFASAHHFYDSCSMFIDESLFIHRAVLVFFSFSCVQIVRFVDFNSVDESSTFPKHPKTKNVPQTWPND